MDPIMIMTIMVLLVPVVFFIVAFMPLYIGVWASLYMIYAPQDGSPNPVMELKFEFSQVFDQYSRLYGYWRDNGATMENMEMMLFGPPAIGALASCIFTYRFVVYLRNIFRVSD